MIESTALGGSSIVEVQLDACEWSHREVLQCLQFRVGASISGAIGCILSNFALRLMRADIRVCLQFQSLESV